MFKKIIVLTIISACAVLFAGGAFAGESQMLKNGVTLVEKPRPFTDTVTVAIFIKGGLFNETPETNGIGGLTSRVWLKSNKILETAEFYGGLMAAKLTPYAFELSFSSPTASAGKLFDDFEQFLLAPKFDKKIFEREKSLLLEELIAQKDNPNAIAYEGFNSAAFAGTPYAMPQDGKPESINTLKVKDVENYYKTNFKGAMMVVAIAGNYDKKFLDDLKKMLSKIDKGEVRELKCEHAEFKEPKRIEETDTRIQQAKLYIGYNAPSVSSEQYPALKVLTEVLGGGMSSRYFSEIRKNLGYAYSVGAAYPSRMCSSRFFVSAGLDYANVEHAIETIDKININLKETLTEEEITKGKNSILGSALMETQSNAAVAWSSAFFETMGLGADYYDKYVETLRHIDKAKLLEAAKIFNGPKVIYMLKPAERAQALDK